MVHIAKISRPRLSGIMARERLFRLLDKARQLPVTFISAPAGAGKTSLAVSYLESRGLPSVWYKLDPGDEHPATFLSYLELALDSLAQSGGPPLPSAVPQGGLGFSRRFFKELIERAKPPWMLVLDDYQEIAADAPLHRVLLAGLTRLVEGVSVLIMSRGAPPAAFARLAANRQMSLLGWQELRLTGEECRKIWRLQKLGAAELEKCVPLLAEIDGWAAGLQIMINGCLTSRRPLSEMSAAGREDIFGYFSGEVFADLAEEERNFLVRTSFLRRMSAEQASRLTGLPHAGELLLSLCRANRFTSRTEGEPYLYEYHPLFRQFLQDRASRLFSPQQVQVLRQKSAGLMLADGQEDEAAALLRQAGDWHGLAWLILQKARSLTGQGRQAVLRNWLEALPQSMVVDDPRLLYWLGMATEKSDGDGARRCLARALDLFQEEGGEPPELLLAWAGVVECLLAALDDGAALDRYVTMLPHLLPDPEQLPAGEPLERVTVAMYAALVIRHPRHADFPAWEARGLRLAATTNDGAIRSRLLAYAAMARVCSGNCEEAQGLLDMLRRPGKDDAELDFATRSRIIGIRILLANACGQFDQALALLNEGLGLAEAHGVSGLDPLLLGNGIRAAILAGDGSRAAMLLQRMAAMPRIRNSACQYWYHYLYAALALQEGRVETAATAAALAMQLADAAMICYAGVACLLLRAAIAWEQGNREDAWQLLEQGTAAAAAGGYGQFVMQGLLLRASFAFGRGEQGAGLAALRQAMDQGGGRHGLLPFMLQSAVLAQLCARAVMERMQTGYVRKIVQRCRLKPPPQTEELEEWSWMLCIYTLGRFGLTRQGEKLPGSANEKAKPFALLKALLARGGRGVSELNIMSDLWPEVDGDKARRSFDTTLFRLRQILNVPDAIQVQKGRLTIDPRCCWVDSWAFERLLNRAEVMLQEDGDRSREAFLLARKAFCLYHGSFLTQDNDEDWSISMRKRLQSRFARGIEFFGSHLETTGQWQEAVGLYRQAVEKSPLSEIFYQRLMVCLDRMQQRTEALQVYADCCQMLRNGLDSAPSAATEAIYRALRVRMD
jgi:ATP/maltotriose-dependent transcriptional regulator MalT/DNA-binding SARP family transcriptional activator